MNFTAFPGQSKTKQKQFAELHMHEKEPPLEIPPP